MVAMRKSALFVVVGGLLWVSKSSMGKEACVAISR